LTWDVLWGIGEILGLTIMYEAGDMNRFASAGNFALYCRYIDARRLSNGKKKADNSAKNGDKYLAWTFVEVAHFAIRFYPEAKSYHDRKTAKTNGVVVIKAIAHKLARVMGVRPHVGGLRSLLAPWKQTAPFRGGNYMMPSS
jgi:transposase